VRVHQWEEEKEDLRGGIGSWKEEKRYRETQGKKGEEKERKAEKK
jgi:hypothetical protein